MQSTPTLTGKIYDEYDNPLPKIKVKVFDKNLRTETLLAEQITDANGFYQVSYTAPKPSASEYKTADLFIRVFTANGKLLGQSPVSFNAGEHTVIDYKLGNTPYRGDSEYSLLFKKIKPIAEAGKVALGKLQEDEQFRDITFLAGETGEPADRISFLNMAFSFPQIKLQPEIFYGLLRMGFPAELPALLTIKPASIVSALEKAIEANIISSQWTKELAGIVQTINALAVKQVMDGNTDPQAAFKILVNPVLPDEQSRKTFLDTYFANEEQPEIFWKQLQAQTGFKDGKVIAKLQQAFALQSITGVPKLSSYLLKTLGTTPGLKDLPDLAAYTKNDWKELIKKAAVDIFPEYIKGDNSKEKTENYAVYLEQRHRQLHPTVFFASRFKADTAFSIPGKKDIALFLSNNPGFDLQAGNISKQLEQANVNGVTDQKTLKQQLLTLGRLYKLDPAFENIKALYAAGIHSATQLVQQQGSEAFVAKYAGGLGGAAKASAIYKKAVSTSKKSAALLAGFKLGHDVSIYAMNGSSEPPPGYYDMFGDAALCDCEHCQSVYSPAAYFTDVLSFLKRNDSYALAELLGRRPDLEHILLTCENTNTPLPYIDLVNELLEKQVLNVAGNPQYVAAASFQTEGDAAELDVLPEHSTPAAYQELEKIDKDTLFSPLLPFDPLLQETMLYTAQLGREKHELLALFYGSKMPGKWRDADLAAALFGMPETYAANFIAPADAVYPVPANVEELIAQLNISYISLLQLLQTDFLNRPVNNILPMNISQDFAPGDTEKIASCDLKRLKLRGLTSEWMIRLARFMRLQRKLGWDVFDLDRALTATNLDDFPASAQEINDQLLLPFSHIEQFHRRLGLSYEQAAAMAGTIGTTAYADNTREGSPLIPSLYDQLFRNRAFTSLPGWPFTETGKELQGDMGDHEAAISAALGLSAADLTALDISAMAMSLENLSHVYRHVLLAKALGTSVAGLCLAISFIGIRNTGNKWETAAVLEFVERWELLKASGIPATGFKAMLNDRVGAAYKMPVDADLLAETEQDLAVLELIKNILDAPVKAEALSSWLLEITADFRVIENRIAAEGIRLTDAGDIALHAGIGKFTDQDNVTALALLTTEELIEKLRSFKVSLENYLFWKTTPLVFRQFGFELEDLEWLKENSSAIGLSLLWSEEVQVPGTTHFEAFRKLYQLSLLNKQRRDKKLRLTGLLDIIIQNQPNAKEKYYALFSTMFQVPESSLVILAGSAGDINSHGTLNMNYPKGLLDPGLLLNMISAAGAIKELGAGESKLQALLKINPEPADTELVKQLLKAKYSGQSWMSVFKPISDSLRTSRRDALTAWLLAKTNAWKTADDIYYALLIDPRMEASMATSRIKQAISSVQLFVDRCLMNLEPGIELNTDFTNQWNTWRKQYRVWEANRKIFLYPENWIEPELRDDKSPFFSELEAQLKQNEITEDIAKDALLTYLDKLDAVANLEMIGLFNEEENGVVHAFGRTQNIPHQYYYRRHQNNVWTAWQKVELDIEGDHILPVVWNGRLMLFWAQFTEKQQTSGDTTINPVAGNAGTMTIKSAPAENYLEIKLAWSEYKKGKWASKKISKEAASTQSKISHSLSDPKVFDKNQLQLTSFISANKLFINIFAWSKFGSFYFDNRYLDKLCFDNCNSSPSLLKYDENNNPLVEDYEIDQYVINNMMLLNERIDTNPDSKFTIFETGIIKRHPTLEQSVVLFNNTPGQFTLTTNHYDLSKNYFLPFFYKNEFSNFYVSSRKKIRFADGISTGGLNVLSPRQPVPVTNSSIAANVTPNAFFQPPVNSSQPTVNPHTNAVPPALTITTFQFRTFYHPYVCSYIKTVNTKGIDDLYIDSLQSTASRQLFIKNGAYDPTDKVSVPYPSEEVDFSYSGAYSLYNWELFFHIPLLIATRLSQNQKFAEARKWFHYIFDPTKFNGSGTGVEKFWITKPFKEVIQQGNVSLTQLLQDKAYMEDLNRQLDNWEHNSFNPHAVARMRLSAYMRNTVLRYIDNLIGWGDQLFRRDTLETINEATLLYVLASNILGKQLEKVPARALPKEVSFADIKDKLDGFSNAMMDVEQYVGDGSEDAGNADDQIFSPLFCLPKNDELLKYWDTVADRLFKIRHSENIDGVFRQLPLFEPPIDPALLVRATAAGLSINTVLDDGAAGLPLYRFQAMLQHANELCNDVKMLGGALLSALEKQDAEELSLLRSGHELNMLSRIRNIKESQRDEAKQNLDSLLASRVVIEDRGNYYGSREFKNSSEKSYFDKTNDATSYQEALAESKLLASLSYLLPEMKIGSGFTIGATYGGANIGKKIEAAADSLSIYSNLLLLQASMANTIGGYQRRQDDWDFQTRSATLELKQLDKQILAAEIRLAITEKELENHDLQTQQSQEVDDYMRSKFSNAALYDYMAKQVSTLYFQCYQMAYNAAKKAEKCLNYELGSQSRVYIQGGYWDSLKQGLLSGERLQYDLRQLENAYLEQNKREFELTKHVSLSMLDPGALIRLRATGSCDFQLPEVMYDIDHPGHYFRRLKSVSISIPCIAGPYTSVSASLKLTESACRTKDHLSDELKSFGKDQSIATSSAQNDSGVFELNFRDERYLPFEGTGAISNWKLELPEVIRQFDYSTIADAILHIKYTARNGSETFKKEVNDSLAGRLAEVQQDLTENGLHTSFNVKHDFANEWLLLKKSGTATLSIDKPWLPYMAQAGEAAIVSTLFIAKMKDENPVTILSIGDTTVEFTEMTGSGFNEAKGTTYYSCSSTAAVLGEPFILSVTGAEAENLEELMMIIKYSFR